MYPSPTWGWALLLLASLASAAISVSQKNGHLSEQSGHYEPMVAMLCPSKDKSAGKNFQNKFLSSSGKWETDYGVKAICITEKINILEYCKQVYPDKEITNVVESTKYEKIGEWCRTGNMKCRGPARWVKPFRCIESLPETVVEPVSSKVSGGKEEYYYNDEYTEEEEDDDEYYYDDIKDEKEVDTSNKKDQKEEKPVEKENIIVDQEDDYYDDSAVLEESSPGEQGGKESITSDKKEGKESKTSGKDGRDSAEEGSKEEVSPASVAIDAYYTHYLPGQEHEEFTRALHRVENRHRVKMTKVMKEWTEIESRYESLAKTDRGHADILKQEMSEQFEKRIEDLEKETQAEKEQLIAMHQQRVVSRINEGKEEAMKCYTNSLNTHPLLFPAVRDCLEKLLRSLHKDRHHTLAHYRTLVKTSPAQADQQKEVTLQHLTDIDRIMNESLSLLDRFPELRVKLLPLMEDFLIELRSKDDTPSPLFSMDRASEEKILDGFKTSLQDRIIKQEERSREEKKLRKEKLRRMKEQEEKMMQEEENMLKEEMLARRRKKIDLPPVDLLPVELLPTGPVLPDRQDRVLHSNAQAHRFSLDQPEYSVSGVEGAESGGVEGEESRLGYISLLGVGAVLILLVVGVLAQRRKHTNIRSHQGFVEVPTYSSPEDKHISTMQASGYENPTYKYFEATVA